MNASAPWFTQYKKACFIMAVMNYAMYLGKDKGELPKLRYMLDMVKLKLNEDAFVRQEAIIAACGLKLVREESDKIWRTKEHGILSLKIATLPDQQHFALYFRKDNKIHVINAMYPKNKIPDRVFTSNELENFILNVDKFKYGYYYDGGRQI